MENSKPDESKIYENNDDRENLLSIQIKYGLSQIYNNYCKNNNKKNNNNSLLLNYYCCSFLENDKKFNTNYEKENNFL